MMTMEAVQIEDQNPSHDHMTCTPAWQEVVVNLP